MFPSSELLAVISRQLGTELDNVSDWRNQHAATRDTEKTAGRIVTLHRSCAAALDIVRYKTALAPLGLEPGLIDKVSEVILIRTTILHLCSTFANIMDVRTAVTLRTAADAPLPGRETGNGNRESGNGIQEKNQ